MRIICFDTEVFKYDWLFCAKDLTNGKDFCFWNDREAFADFYTEYRNDLWIGYNVKGYDQFIVKGILCGLNPYKISQHIIKDDQPGWSFSNAFRNVPLNFYDAMSNRNMGSLKTLEGFMGMDIEETQVDFNLDRSLTDEERDLTEKYCKHDVESTCAVLNQTMNMFSAHIAIINTFKRPLRDMCKTQAQLAAKVLDATPTTFNDYYDIRMPETLEVTKYRHVVDWFMNAYDDTVKEMLDAGENPDDSDAFANWFYGRSLEVDIAGVPSTFAWGGLHGAIPQFNYTCKDDEVMFMVDVDQLYPSLMVYYNLLSRAVKQPEKYKGILDTSLRLKAEGKKKEREPYKLICNITYGSEGDKFNAMYDPLHRNLVCVFGQVLLLDLVEKIEAHCKLIQANTDGLLVLVKKKDVDTLKDIIRAWEERTYLHMSFDEFKTIYQKDVNNYVAVTKDGKFKSKGAYVKGLTALDYDLPIVNKAVTEYLVKGTHPRATIMACDDLIEFQKIYKVSSKYSHAVMEYEERYINEVSSIEYPKYLACKYLGYYQCDYFNKTMMSDTPCKTCNNFTPRCPKVNYVKIYDGEIERLNDRTFRVFASTNPNDGTLKKVKSEGAKPEKFALCPDRCFIWNQSVVGVKVPTYLDKEYYISLAIKRIEDFGIEVKA